MNLWALFLLTIKSLRNRKFTVGLTITSICLSVFLLLMVETVRTEAKHSFTNTISGTDLLVGARSGSVQLLLYSVFRIGNATNNVTWESYQELAARPEVDWIVPISLGDSHRQFRVMGTSAAFFEHYKYRRDRSLVVAEGALGVARVGYLIDGGINWRFAFNAAAPVLSGFEKERKFVL